MRPLLVVSLGVFAASAWAEDLPPTAVLAISEYDNTVAKAKAEFEAKEREARKRLIVALQRLATSEGKRGNLDGALAIKKRIEALSADDRLPTPGEYQLSNAVFVITVEGEKVSLSVKGGTHQSTGMKLIENRLFFSWSNANDLMVVERLAPDRISIACYSGGARSGIPKNLRELEGKAAWTHEGTLVSQ